MISWKCGDPFCKFCALGSHDHICAFYDNDLEKSQFVFPLVRHALAKNFRVIFLDVAVEDSPAHRVEEVSISEQLRPRRNQVIGIRLPCPASYADAADLVFNTLQLEIPMALTEAHDGVCLIMNTGWELRLSSGIRSIKAFESEVENFVRFADCMAVCMFDQRQLPESDQRSIASVHRLIARGTRIYDNPDYFGATPQRWPKSESGSALYGVYGIYPGEFDKSDDYDYELQPHAI